MCQPRLTLLQLPAALSATRRRHLYFRPKHSHKQALARVHRVLLLISGYGVSKKTPRHRSANGSTWRPTRSVLLLNMLATNCTLILAAATSTRVHQVSLFCVEFFQVDMCTALSMYLISMLLIIRVTNIISTPTYQMVFGHCCSWPLARYIKSLLRALYMLLLTHLLLIL